MKSRKRPLKRPLILRIALALTVLAAMLLVYLDALVSTTFSDRRWEIPASVYARPLELYPGLTASADDVAEELALLGYRSVATPSAPGQMRRQGERIDLYTREFRFPDELRPAGRLSLEFSSQRLERLRSGGTGLPLYRLEPVQIGGIYPRHQEDRLLLKLGQSPASLRQALLAVEDRRFYQHWGISLTGIARAAWVNLRAGRLVQGGSTITQQLIKNYYLTRERSFSRKLTEVVMAALLELHAEKDEILEAYLNEVYLGQDGPRAIHGFGLASRHYFDQPLEELALHQQALLVGMVKGPSLYNPLRHPERARARRDVVLGVMRAENLINEAEYRVAIAMPLGLSQRPRIMNSFPAFLDLVRRQLRRDYREQDLGAAGLKIFTSFDPRLQRQAEASIQTVLDGLDPGGELQAAMVVTSFGNGEVRAMIGGRQPRFAGFNRAVDAVRPVGSLIKPVVYLTALEEPERWTLASPLDDSEFSVELDPSNRWSPANFDQQSHGTVLLHRALSQSYNQATARLGMELGTERVRATLEQLGVEREQPDVPAMLLGAGGLAPLDVASLYQSIAAGGFNLPLHTIRDVVAADGTLLQRFPLAYEQVASTRAIHLLHYALREVVQEGTGKIVYSELPAGFAVAGKTGTTNDNRDSWFAGFAGDLLAVNWIGRDDNAATGLTGATGAARVWSHFMARASAQPLAYRVPDGVEHFWVDEASGKLSGRSCADARLLPFVAGSEPTERGPCARTSDRIIEWFRELF
ncbi:MAG: penicillin-binding protein 1B [Halieaceae bacterium]|nr:penicillin-binding protein 1B [Halieaceae bacterium]